MATIPQATSVDQCTLYTVHYTVYIYYKVCSVESVYCTLYSVHCTVYSTHKLIALPKSPTDLWSRQDESVLDIHDTVT